MHARLHHHRDHRAPTDNGNGEPDTTLERTFTIAAHPLTVSFQNLAFALTCPNFDLSKLSEQVPRTVLAAKKGGATTGRASAKTRVDFTIEFDGKDMGVWVKDADSYQGKSSQDVCNDVKEWIRPSDDYTNYLLNVKVYNNECEGLQGYGSQEYKVNALLSSRSTKLIYGTSCLLGSVACRLAVTAATAVILGVEEIQAYKSAKDIGSDAVACYAAPWITGILYQINKATETPGIMPNILTTTAIRGTTMLTTKFGLSGEARIMRAAYTLKSAQKLTTPLRVP